MAPIRVGILRGGKGHEYEVSLKTGAEVLKNLNSEKYQPVDILLTRDGTWHLGGLPVEPTRAIQAVDVVFNALHGEYGEDGQIQQFLDYQRVPYTGSGAVASALGMDKPKSKEIFKKNGLKVPCDVILRPEDLYDIEEAAHTAFRQIAPPWIVKPAGNGSSVGLYLARTYPELVQAIEACSKYGPVVMVEEYVRGREATCGVVDGLRGMDYYPLLPVEIITPAHKKLFDYEAKYSGESSEICPGRFSREEKNELENLSKVIHKSLGLRHYSRSDFIISPKGVYVLEVNTLPGLTEQSLLPKSLRAAGITYDRFLDHLVTLALER